MIIPVGFAQANLKFTGSALPNGAEIAMGINQDSGMTATQVAQGVINAWSATMRGYTASSVVLSSVLAKLGPNTTGPSAEVAANLACTGSGQVDPPSVAFLVHKTTTIGGRQGRGRFYLPCPSEGSVVDGGLIESSAFGVIQGLLDDFEAALETENVFPVLLHGDALTPSTVTAFVLDARIGTQRRRNRG